MTLRSNIRTLWMILCRKVRLSLTACTWCGQRGVESISVPEAMLCRDCDTTYQKALARRGTSKLVQEFVNAYGSKELRRDVSEFKNEPGYYGLRLDSIIEDEAEDIPNFDTYPGPAPTRML